jgi:hypothetical protein
VDGSGQLGTISSSRRFKYEIQDMGEVSDKLLRLRPVTFRYKQVQTDGSHPLQYGLIAEEVAEVMPELVAYDADGQPQTVQYHVLPTLLLNELQKQRQLVEEQRSTIARQQVDIQELAARLAKLEALITPKP